MPSPQHFSVFPKFSDGLNSATVHKTGDSIRIGLMTRILRPRTDGVLNGITDRLLPDCFLQQNYPSLRVIDDSLAIVVSGIHFHILSIFFFQARLDLHISFPFLTERDLMDDYA